jgi:hypothetical protein
MVLPYGNTVLLTFYAQRKIEVRVPRIATSHLGFIGIVFDPVPRLIAAVWHMHNLDKYHGMLGPKALFRPIKMGWLTPLTLADVRHFFEPFEYVTLTHYNDRLDEQRYPLVIVSRNEAMPTPSQHVLSRCQEGLATYSDDYPYGLLGEGGERERERGRVRLLLFLFLLTATLLVCVQKWHRSQPRHRQWWRLSQQKRLWSKESPQSKPKHQRAKGPTKTHGHAKPKALRRECSRPEVR